MGTQPGPTVDILSMATFAPHSLSFIVMTETVWPIKPKIFIIRSFTEAACQYLNGLSCLNLTATVADQTPNSSYTSKLSDLNTAGSQNLETGFFFFFLRATSLFQSDIL